MIKIRTKLLIYFASIIVLLILLFVIREESNDRVMELYNENVDNFFLLNEITRVTDETLQSLQIYVHEPLLENLQSYEQDKEELQQLQEDFDENGSIAHKNVLQMMYSFIEQTDQTVEGVSDQNIQAYSQSLSASETTSGYIHEATLDLINSELTSYQELSILIDEKVENTQKMGLTILAAIIILSILFALWFSNGITRTIERLTKAALEISAGRYTGDDVVVSQKDELWFLTNTFNEMKQNILESVSDIEEKARLGQLLKEMELKALQNQINPHFLFNTLNTISKTSYIEGAERTSDLISAVSALFRYNIGSLKRETTLKDEVNIIREYFFIQKARFRDRVNYIEEVDPACHLAPLPCLTLQPIVENAFIHGIESIAQGAEIILSIYQEEDMVCIDVVDNGIGMSEETIQRLLEKEEELEAADSTGHSTGIGMRNVRERLQLFHKDSVFTISSRVGEGTRVSIRLPKKQERRMQRG